MNDLYDLGFQTDKLLIVHRENERASIDVKTPTEIYERIDISNTMMQGTVWAGISCTATMDKLGKQVYENPSIENR